MRKQIFAFKAQQQPDEQTPSSEYFEAENSLRISNKEIAKFGLMSNMAILAMAAIAPFINVLVDF
ncbi:hypothetical protein P4S68_18475 [Pseudoalteromonas sp. Hal099]